MPVSEEVVQQVQSRLGSTIDGKWQLTRVLGIGGMAAVYAAVHRNQNRVAIKMLHDEQSRSESMRARFLREGYAANTVDHAGAVRVFDDGIADGAAYLVMELLEGETLEDRHTRLGGRLPAAEVLVLADQLLDVLAAAHDKGIIHRDIKPDNLFLTAHGDLKVLDFGIARLKEIQSSGGTSTQTLMGTPSFMPPEQARARWNEVDARSDVWSTGATLYYLLSGSLVHEGETFAEQLAQAVREPVKPLLDVDSSVPRVVAEIIDRAVAYTAADRWQTARNMQAAVRRAQKLVGPPRTSSVRTRDADPGRSETPTLLATPDGRGALLLQSAALTPGKSGSAAGSKRHWPVAFALALALAVALFAVWSMRPSASVGPPEPSTQVEPSPPSELAAEPRRPEGPAPRHPAGEQPGASSTAPHVAASGPAAAATKQKVVPSERKPAASAPSRTAPEPRTAPSSTGSIFDRRF